MSSNVSERRILQNVNADAVWMNTTVSALVCTLSVSCVQLYTAGSMKLEVPMAVNIRAGVPGCLGHKFCMVVPNVFGFTAWMLLFVALLAPRILRWLLGCWKMHGLVC